MPAMHFLGPPLSSQTPPHKALSFLSFELIRLLFQSPLLLCLDDFIQLDVHHMSVMRVLLSSCHFFIITLRRVIPA